MLGAPTIGASSSSSPSQPRNGTGRLSSAVLQTRGALSTLSISGEPEKLEVALQQLSKCSVIRECLDIIVNSGPRDAVQLLVDVFNSWPTSTGILVALCSTISTIIQNCPALCSRFEATDTPKHVLSMAMRHPADAFIQGAAMKCLATLAEHCDPRTSMLLTQLRSDRQFPSLLSTLSTFQHDPSIQASICKILAVCLKPSTPDTISEELDLDCVSALDWLLRSGEYCRVVNSLAKHASRHDVQLSACHALQQIAVLPLLKTQLIGGGVHEHVAQALAEDHTAEFAVAATVLLCRLSLVDDWETHGLLVNTGVLEVVADSAEKHSSSADLQGAACMLLERLGKMALRSDYKIERWLVLLQHMMGEHVMSGPVQAAACRAICCLISIDTSLQDLVGDVGEEIMIDRKTSTADERQKLCTRKRRVNATVTVQLHHLVVMALNVHGDQNRDHVLAEHAFRALYWMCEDNARMRRLLLQKGAHSTVVNCLKNHPELAPLQEWGIRVLHELARGSERCYNDVYNSSAHSVALAALKAFGGNPDIQQEAIGLLTCLSLVKISVVGSSGISVRSDQFGQVAALKFCDDGFISLVMKALCHHQSQITLVETAFEAIAIVLDLLPTQRAEVMELKAVDVILLCMSCYVEDAGIQAKGCMLLRYLGTPEQFCDEAEADDSADAGFAAGVPTDVWSNQAMIDLPVMVETSPSMSPAIRRVLAKLDRSAASGKNAKKSRSVSGDSMDISIVVDSALPVCSNASRCVDAACLITLALQNFADDDLLLSEACLAIKELAEHGEKIKSCFVEQAAHRQLFKVLRRDQLAKTLLDDVCSAVHVLCSSSLKNRMLLQGVEDEDSVVARFLLHSGADVNCIDRYNNITPLSWAARNNDLEMTQILLQYDVSDLRSPLKEALDIEAHSIIAQLLQAIVSEQRLPGVAVLSGYELHGLRASWLESILCPVPVAAAPSRRPSTLLDGNTLKAQRWLIGYNAAQRRASLSDSPPSPGRLSHFSSDSVPGTIGAPSIEEEDVDELPEFNEERPEEVFMSNSQGQIMSNLRIAAVAKDTHDSGASPSLYSDTSPTPGPEVRPLHRRVILAPVMPVDNEEMKSPLCTISPRVVRPNSRTVSGVAFLPFSGHQAALPTSLCGGTSDQPRVSNGGISTLSSSSVLRARIKSSTFISSPNTMRLNMTSTPEGSLSSKSTAPGFGTLLNEAEIQRAAARAMRSPRNTPIRVARVLSGTLADGLTELDISDNGIPSLNRLLEAPSIVRPLASLVFLNVSHNKLTDFPFALARCFEALKHLQMSNNAFTHFPQSMFHLHALERLSITNNEISSLEDMTQPLVLAQQVRDSCGDEFCSSPSSSRPMSPAASRGQLSPSPSSGTLSASSSHGSLNILLCEALNELTELQLAENFLTTLPSDFCNAFPYLKQLGLSANRLQSIPATAIVFSRLVKLDLCGNQLEELSQDLLDGCPSLENLKADNNKISRLPGVDCARQLEALTHVSLAGNRLVECEPEIFPSFLLNLPRLRYVDISNNNLVCLPPPDKWQGKGLRTLMAAQNKIPQLDLGKDAGTAWPVMDRLNLQDNELERIPSNIGDLDTLSSLNVDGNRAISILPASFGQLKRLWEFPRQNLPNLELDPALKLSRVRDIVSYMHDRHENAAPYYRIRMLVVGRACQGKTTLLRQLTGMSFNRGGDETRPGERVGMVGSQRMKVPGRKQSVAATTQLSTVGVSVSDWKCYRRIRGKQLPYTISCWDFAGQEEYYSTHQCFLSTRSLYLAVYNMQEEHAIQKLKPWLLNIQARAPGCPVLAVGTHLDLLEPAQSQKSMAVLRTSLDNLRGKAGMPKIVSHEFVSCCKKNPTIARLRSVIFSAIDNAKTASKQPILGGAVPAVYIALEERIIQEAKRLRQESSAYPIIHERRMRQLANEVTGKGTGSEKLSKEKMTQAVRFLHESGVLLHYEDSQVNLSDLYFLDPEWLCSMMAKIVTHKEINRFLQDGIMKKSQVDLLFIEERRRLPPKFIKQYLRLLERFEIVLSHEKDGEEYLLIPSMLPAKRRIPPCPGFGLRRIIRHYQMPYIPLGFMARFIARLYLFADSMLDNKPEKTMWRSGVHMHWPHVAFCVVEVVGDGTESGGGGGAESESAVGSGFNFDATADTVVIEVACNPYGRQLLGYLADHFDTLVEEWYSGLCENDVQGNALIKSYAVCPECLETPVDPLTGESCDSYHFSLHDLVLQSEGSAIAECPFHSIPVPIRDLAPDIMLGDLPDHLILDPAVLNFDAASAHRLGKGGFGDVFRWTYKGSAVAVKVFKSRGGDTTSSSNRSLRQEVQVMRHLQHPSIIDLVGVQLQPRLLVMELAPQGSLRSVLARKEALFRPVQHRIAAQVAEGLEFLHRKRILYRDLKSDNVLIFSTNATARINAKISDYGISRFACPAGLAATTGTVGSRPPEMIRACGKISYDFSADIYPFGLLLFEIVTNGRPFEDLDFAVELDNRYLEEAPIPQITECGCRPWPDMQDTIAQCLQMRPDQRPTASALVQRFRSAESLCLRLAVPVSMGLSVQALTVRNYRDGRNEEKCQVWIGSGSTSGAGSQLSIFDLSEQPSPASGMVLSDRLVLCMATIRVNEKPLLVLVGCLSGKLWLYDAVLGRQQQPCLVTCMPDAIVSLLHFDDGQETNVVIAGLANGSMAILEHSQVAGVSTSSESLRPQIIELGSQPLMDLCMYKRQVWCACGSQVIVLDIIKRQPAFCWSMPDDGPKRQISNLALSNDLAWTSIKGSATIYVWSAGESIGRERGELNVLDFIREREPPEDRNRVLQEWHVVSMLLDGGSLWVGMSGGHLVVIDITKRQAQAVVRRHVGAVRCIVPVKVRFGDKPLSYVLTGGMGYLPRPGLKDDMFRMEGTSFQSSDTTYGHLLVWDASMGKMQARMNSDHAKRHAGTRSRQRTPAKLQVSLASPRRSSSPQELIPSPRTPSQSVRDCSSYHALSFLTSNPDLDSSFDTSFETVESPVLSQGHL